MRALYDYCEGLKIGQGRFRRGAFEQPDDATPTGGKSRKRNMTSAYLVSADGLWAWEQGGATALTRRFLSG